MTSPELLLISAMLRTKDHVTPAANGITSEMFHGYPDEFEWIESYIQRNNRTPSKGAFQDNFPNAALPAVDDVEFYCGEVADLHTQKVLTKGIAEVMRDLKKGDTESAILKWTKVSSDAQASLFGGNHDGDIFREYSDIESEVLDRKKRREETGFAGIPTGFPTLDELTGGLQPGWFILISARLGKGKTRALIRMSCAAAFSGYTVQYDALEQSRAEIAMQVHAFASSEFGKSVFRSLDLAQGKEYDEKSYKLFLRKLSDEVKGKLHVADNRKGRIGAPTVMAQIKKNHADIVFLDSLYLMPGGEDWQSFSNLSTEMAQTAKQTGCTIVTAAQINRKGAESKHTGAEHLAGADRLGQDADLAINIEQFSKSVLVFHVIKFRHGPDNWKFYLKFDPNNGVMEEITFLQAQELRDLDSDNDDAETVAKKFVPRKKGSFKATADIVHARKMSQASLKRRTADVAPERRRRVSTDAPDDERRSTGSPALRKGYR